MATSAIRAVKQITCDNAFDLTVTALKTISDLSPVPPLTAATNVVLSILQIVSDLKTNQQGCTQLALCAKDLLLLFQRCIEGKPDAPKSLLDDILEFEATLSSIHEYMCRLSQMNRIRRVVEKAKIKDELTQHEQKLSGAKWRFLLSSLIETRYRLNVISPASLNTPPRIPDQDQDVVTNTIRSPGASSSLGSSPFDSPVTRSEVVKRSFGHHQNHPYLFAPPEPIYPSIGGQIPSSSRESMKKKSSPLADIQEIGEGVSAMSQPRSGGLSVYSPSGHGRAMDDPNTSITVSAPPKYFHSTPSRMSVRPSPKRVRHEAVEPRGLSLEPRQSMVQSAPPPQKLQTLQDSEWTNSGSSSPQIQGEGDGWRPRDQEGVPHWHSGSETSTPPSPTETIPDVAAGVSEGFDIYRNQSNNFGIRRDEASVPSHNCYHPDTDDDANDKGNDNCSERFSDVASEDNDNGPHSLKMVSKRSFSTWNFRSTRSVSSTDSDDTWSLYD